MDIENYINIYRENERSALHSLSQSFEGDGRDPEMQNAVAISLMLSFDEIKKRYPRAAELLCLMSFFHRQAMPRSLLGDENYSTLKETVGKLLAYSVVTKNANGRDFDMHRLVQPISRG